MMYQQMGLDFVKIHPHSYKFVTSFVLATNLQSYPYHTFIYSYFCRIISDKMQRCIFLLFILYPAYTASQFISPCPNLFSYDKIEVDSWTGTLRVPIDAELSGIWLKAVFDRPFDGLLTNFGESVHREPNEYLIRRPNNKVEAGTTVTITITASNNPVLGAPQLLGYRLNGKTLCPENGEIPPPPPVESLSAGGGGLQSPCPALFSYEPLGVEGNRWYGNIHVKSDSELSGVWIRVILDKLPVEFGTLDFGTTEQKDTNDYLIKNRNHKVKVGEVLQIRVHADFIPGEEPPKLLGYRLNAKTVCPENGVIELPVPESPCPALFQYEARGSEKDRWNGNINVASPAELSGVWMRVLFDKPVTDLGTDFGEIKRRGDGDFLIKNPMHTILAGDSVKIRISPQFNPNDVAPKLLEIRLNGRTVCPENGIVETTTLSIAQQLISPCPEMFTYEPPGPESDKWYGLINLMSSTQLNGLWLRIILDRQSLQLGNWFGQVKTDDNIIYRVQNRDYKLAPGDVVPLRFFIKYNPAEPIPKLQEIKINAVTVCPSSGNSGAGLVPISGGSFPTQNQVTPSTNWVTTVAPRPAGGRPKPDWAGAWRPPSATSAPEFQCGEVITKPIALLWGGAPTEEGEWPWHAALYYTGGGAPEYYCGGVLVSLNHVLTAAHCVTITSTRTPMSTNDVQVFLGKYLLSQSNRGVQYMQVRKVLVHPEYDNNNYANDIAVLYLNRPADYTDWVRPVCLWAEDTSLNSVENREGTVVGWGYDNRGQVTDKLLKAGMPVVSKIKCIWSNKKFYKRFVNDGSRNFCAGFRNGTSVCTGDSGGGLVFPMGGSRWQLRGLVSLSVALQDAASLCDTSHYVVFTDVAQFLPWVQQAFNTG